jgi:hypothetical protein
MMMYGPKGMTRGLKPRADGPEAGVILDVWAHNLETEIDHLGELLPYFPYVAMV